MLCLYFYSRRKIKQAAPVNLVPLLCNLQKKLTNALTANVANCWYYKNNKAAAGATSLRPSYIGFIHCDTSGRETLVA